MNKLILSSEVWFKRLLWVLIIYTLITAVITFADFLLHPFAISAWPTIGDAVFRKAFGLLVAGPATLLVGVLVIRRSPNNTVGLLLMLWGAALATLGLSNETSPVVFSTAAFPVSAQWTALIFLAAYFPNGLSVPRWLNLVYVPLFAMQIPLGVFNQMIIPTFTNLKGNPINPMYWSAAQVPYTVLLNASLVVFIPLLPIIVVSQIIRYRRASYTERLQIKWFAFWGIAILVPYLVFYFTLIKIYPDMNSTPQGILDIGKLFIFMVGLFPTVAISFAMLRHRLYDIDIIIRRTLIYAILSAILAIVFFGGVTLTQTVLRGVTGPTSDIAVVISTLGIAALFTPVRRRVQAAIDRRFYRTKYDAQKTLEQFAMVMRDEVDPEKLKAALIGTIQETMQPTSIALWIREDNQR